MAYEKRKTDSEREDRISMDIVVDANGPEEQAMGWYYYLAEQMQVPFAATCIAKRPTSPLHVKDEVDVIGMADAEECQHEMFVTINWKGEDLSVPLVQLEPSPETDDETKQAVEDWHYWVALPLLSTDRENPSQAGDPAFEGGRSVWTSDCRPDGTWANPVRPGGRGSGAPYRSRWPGDYLGRVWADADDLRGLAVQAGNIRFQRGALNLGRPQGLVPPQEGCYVFPGRQGRGLLHGVQADHVAFGVDSQSDKVISGKSWRQFMSK